MAWYNITYSCGHTERVQLYGPHRDRESYIEYASRAKFCPDCYRAKKDEERRQENERAASLAGEIGLGALTGSEKQVAWATTIRQRALEEALRAGGIKEKIVPLLNHETSAKWWIDNRALGGYRTIETLAKLYA